MKKKLITVLVVIVVVLALLIAGALGYLWYRESHVFVEGDAYPITSESLDLTGEDISIAYYEELKTKLPECEITWVVPFRGGKYVNSTESLLVSSLTLEDIEVLVEYFPNLKTLDASQCDQYDVLAVAEASLPNCEVIYSVNLEGASPDHNAATLIMGFSEEDNFEILITNLKYLPKLKDLTLTDPALSVEQVEELRAAYPEITITCTVELLGQEYDAETTELDLSAMISEDVEGFLKKLAMLPKLAHVDLRDSQLTKEDVKKLMEAAPGVVFDYAFDFFGTTLSTADEEVVIKNTKIGDENEAEVRLALELLGNCKRFVLDNCRMSDEVMAQIREDYRDRTKVVWRVWFGEGSTLTDATAIRAVYDLVDDNCHDLVYCENVKYADFGHNEYLDACDFVAGMKDLEVIIISGAPIKSLEPFANCKNLRILEAAFCEYLYDATPLAQCENLEMVNISYSHITDLTPLDDLPKLTRMTNMYYPKSRVPQEEQDRFIAANPEMETYFVGDQPYGKAWRYDEEGEYLDWYVKVREVFSYDTYPKTPNHVGWYMDEA